MVGDSWTHRIARIFILPLVNTSVRPNHLTAARLVTGVAACVAFAVGSDSWNIWGGCLWIFSIFLDRADGELARASGKASLAGHKFDMICDVSVTSLFFLGVGVGLRDNEVFGIELGHWPIGLGAVSGVGVVVAQIFAELIDRSQTNADEKAYPGIWGFDFDDILYLFALVVWIDWHLYFVLGAAVGAPAFAYLTWYKWRKLNPS